MFIVSVVCIYNVNSNNAFYAVFHHKNIKENQKYKISEEKRGEKRIVE